MLVWTSGWRRIQRLNTSREPMEIASRSTIRDRKKRGKTINCSHQLIGEIYVKSESKQIATDELLPPKVTINTRTHQLATILLNR